jgi:GH25 family lysozyme M1 (1,4-beta-N-acetylmuramidase)
VLTKSRRTLAASTLVLAAAGGGSVALARLTTTAAPTLVSPAALPSAAGPAATAVVPGAGNADGTGSGSAGDAAPDTQPEPGTGSAAATGTATATPGASAAGTTPGGAASPALSPADGQGALGPLAAGALPADGAAPGASTAVRALAAARAATTALPHSPQLLAQLNGSAGATAAAAARTLSGLDVAAFQHPVTAAYPGGTPIHWATTAKAGYKFAAVKATEGDYYVNPWAATDLAQAKSAGLDVTPYHFAVPNASGGAAQAQFAVKYSGYQSGARVLPLMLDIEYDPYVNTDRTNECYGLTTAKMTAWLSAFVTTVRSLTGQYPLIYTTADWWSTCTGKSTAFTADPMWVAAYGFTSPPLPAGWKAWTFWQYRSDGSLPGVDAAGSTDVDRFSPTAVALINPGSQSTRAGASASLKLSSLGALAGEPLTYTAAGLPPGVTVRQSGTLSGTVAKTAAASAAVTYKVSVTAKNTAGGKTTITFTWRISPA